jgi:hypothetical protein
MKLALLSLLVLTLHAPQTATPQKPPETPTTQKPQTTAPQKPSQKAPAQPVSTTSTVTVTDLAGVPLEDVFVTLTGGLDRSGSTHTNGTVKFDGLRPGMYRLRFEKEGFTVLEREFEVRAREPVPNPSVALRPAFKPPPPPPPPAPEPVKPPPPPPGKPVTLSIPDFIERNFITGSQPQKVSPVGCSGLANTVLWQIRDPWVDRTHEEADAMLYVVGGEGTVRLDGRDTTVRAGSFTTVPRGMAYSLTRRGRNPLIILATLSGEPCTQ